GGGEQARDYMPGEGQRDDGTGTAGDEPAAGEPAGAHFVRENRCTASSSSSVFCAISFLSPDAKAPATQCLTCWSSSWNASDSSAVLTAEIWVRMSMQ